MAIQSKKVYIAQSAIFAFIDRAHPKHTQAAAFFRYFANTGYQLFTDYVTISETYQQLYQKIGPSLSRDFLRSLSFSTINILSPEQNDMKAAVKVLTSYKDSELSFPEALMSVLADRRGIEYICSFDYIHPLFGLTLFDLPM
ncbi:MAG TPA: hypothetical protein VLF68_04640 [Candidatus Saccharimonadales bacterium]|nr:hypothetical protein [Candidatus Saccharimonadales bacterium]